MIRLPGYDLVDKMKISQNYLDKKVREMCGLSDRDDVKLNDDAVKSLIRWYCREAGVRNLEKHLERIYRKVALKIVREDMDNDENDTSTETFEIDAKNLHEYVGKPVFNSDRLWGSGEERDEEGEIIPSVPVGVTTGLAWTSMGGSTLYIETIGIENSKSGGLRTTGKLGEVMNESSKIAHTFARRKIRELNKENNFFEETELHLHVRCCCRVLKSTLKTHICIKHRYLKVPHPKMVQVLV